MGGSSTICQFEEYHAIRAKLLPSSGHAMRCDAMLFDSSVDISCSPFIKMALSLKSCASVCLVVIFVNRREATQHVAV